MNIAHTMASEAHANHPKRRFYSLDVKLEVVAQCGQIGACLAAEITDGSATARALDYSLKRWTALTRFLDDGQLPIDDNWIENQIRPIAIGRNNWLFAGSLRAGQMIRMPI